jgi:DNA-binding NarL/FixJ family response regulator
LRGDTTGALAAAVEVHRTGNAGLQTPEASVAAAILAAGAGDVELAESILDEGVPEDERTRPGAFVNPRYARALIGVLRDDRDVVLHNVFADFDAHRAEGHVTSLASAFEMLACCSEPERAVRLLAAASRVRAEMGMTVMSFVPENTEVTLEAARLALGERFEAVWNEGLALDWEQAAEYASRMRGERGRPSHGWESLTPTELAVVDLVAEGLTNPQIAARLMVERSTIKTHMRHVFTKLGVSTRAELAAAAVQRTQGMTPPASRQL